MLTSNEYLESLSGSIFNALGVTRVSITGVDESLVPLLTSKGIKICAQGDLIDALVMTTTLSALKEGKDFPAPHEDCIVFVVCRCNPLDTDVSLRTQIEHIFIDRGYIKHPATTLLFDYASLGASDSECWALFVYRPLILTPDQTRSQLREHRDLHSDMLREAGVRSDAHIVRYQLAAGLVRPGDRVLDAACGLGYGSHILSSLAPTAKIVGVDLSDWAISYARSNYGNDHLEFLRGSLPEALDCLDEAAFDFIVSLETLEHVAEPERLLAAFRRILKPGGRIVVSVPNDWSDESGKDPNPHHLHVYDWDRLQRELSTHFIVEKAWSLTASGCKSGQDHVWQAQPRKLEAVALELAPATNGEWWIACATKSPLASSSVTYEETVHRNFQGGTHLVDFALHYDKPWIVHSIVELPWRLKDKNELVALAKDVIATVPPNTPDHGAGLAVLGWRLLEDEGAVCAAAEQWIAHTERYLTSNRDSTNPHVCRWCVSLDYLAARFYEGRDARDNAFDAYSRVVAADILTITPTLGTKVTDAALRAGILAFQMDDNSRAMAVWHAGLDAAFTCLHAESIEFVGNQTSPFIFSMNDLVEIADGAARLANAIHIMSTNWAKGRATIARLLGSVAQSSLRSAFTSVQAMAEQRGVELKATEDQLSRTQAALEETQALAIARDEALSDISRRLDATQVALEQTQKMALTRAAHNDTLQSALTHAQGLVAERDTRIGIANDKIAAQASQIEELAIQLKGAMTESSATRIRYDSIVSSRTWKLLKSLRLLPRTHLDDR